MDIDSSDEESRYRIYREQSNNSSNIIATNNNNNTNNNRSSPIHTRQSSGLAGLCGKGLIRRITGNRPTSSYIGNSYASKGVQSYPDSDGESSEEDDEESGSRKDRPISFFDPVSWSGEK